MSFFGKYSSRILKVKPGQPTQQASLIQRTDGQSINRTQLQGVLAQAHTKKVASQLQLSTTQLQQLFATPALATTSVKVDDGKLVTRSAKSQASGSVAGFIVGILIYTFVISYASMMAQEIGTEKGSRIEESILTAITPQAQFFGKLLGILALMATQIIIYGVVGLASLDLYRFGRLNWFVGCESGTDRPGYHTDCDAGNGWLLWRYHCCQWRLAYS